MSLDELRSKPGYLIRRAQQIAVGIFMEECEADGITPVQYGALVAIRNAPGIDATRLSSVIAFDRSTLGNVLERLEKRGLIARASGADDRRVKLLKITKQGEDLLREVEPAVARAQERILAPLPPAKRREFLRLLDRLVELNNDVSRAPLRLVAEH